jgi:hypothetical protein
MAAFVLTIHYPLFKKNPEALLRLHILLGILEKWSLIQSDKTLFITAHL